MLSSPQSSFLPMMKLLREALLVRQFSYAAVFYIFATKANIAALNSKLNLIKSFFRLIWNVLDLSKTQDYLLIHSHLYGIKCC